MEANMLKKRAITLVILSFLAATGCGGASSARSGWKPGPMPASGDFDGVYNSDFGRLELSAQGNTVLGLYEGDTHHGRIEGTVKGDLMRFSWVQWKEDMQGKLRETRGRGVFRYIVEPHQVGDQVKEDHSLEGTWGYGNSEVGSPWRAWKALRGKKQLKPHEERLNEMQAGPDYQESVGFESSGESKTEVQAKPVEDTGKSKNKDEGGGNIDLDGLF